MSGNSATVRQRMLTYVMKYKKIHREFTGIAKKLLQQSSIDTFRLLTLNHKDSM